jgi:hypothetical protein
VCWCVPTAVLPNLAGAQVALIVRMRALDSERTLSRVLVRFRICVACLGRGTDCFDRARVRAGLGARAQPRAGAHSYLRCLFRPRHRLL